MLKIPNSSQSSNLSHNVSFKVKEEDSQDS